MPDKRWQKVRESWRSVANLRFWFWDLPRDPRNCFGILAMIVLSNYIDLKRLRFQGERMD